MAVEQLSLLCLRRGGAGYDQCSRIGEIEDTASGCLNCSPSLSQKARKDGAPKVYTAGEMDGPPAYTYEYLKAHNAIMRFETKGSKKEMHQWQHEKIMEYKAQHGGDRPSLNKNDY